MNRVKEYKARKAGRRMSIGTRLGAFGFGKLFGLMLLLGITLGILSVHLIPVVVSAGIPRAAADKIPYFGFGLGVLIAFAAAVSRAAMDALQIGLAIPMLIIAILGTVLAAVMSFLWTLIFLEVAIVAAVCALVFFVVLWGMGKLLVSFESKG